MKYTYKGKVYNVNDNDIDNLMEKLDISLSEACEMWLSDKDMIKDETVEELTAKAQKNRITSTIHKAKGEKKERKAREKKENPLKQEIINSLFYFLSDKGNINFTINEITISNKEKYIDFISNDRSFTINLVEHRKAKN